MRAEPSSAAIVGARLTHQIPVGVDGHGGDALAIVEDGPLPAGSRIFVPGRIPCGECPACRRALCDACAAPRAATPVVVGDRRRVVLADRFIATIDNGELLPLRAIAAGIVADVIGAAGRAGLGAGDTAIWIGEPAWTRIGASWSVGRSCRTFVLAPSSEVHPPAAAPPPVASSSASPVALALPLGPSAWRATIADAEAAGGPAGGRPERRIFICGRGAICGRGIDLAGAAMELATAGSTLSFLRGAPATLTGLDAAPPLRLLTGGAGHPDLIPEALAALSRGEVDTDRLFVEIGAADELAAVDDFRRGIARPIPVVAL